METKQAPSDNVNGYLTRDVKRIRQADGSWKFVKDVVNGTADIPYDPPGPFGDRRYFPDVEFHRESGLPPNWHRELVGSAEIAEAIAEPVPAKSWRWIHCTGLHGPTLEVVAKAAGWDPRKFAGVFTWTRPSMEFAKGLLLTHFINQSIRFFTWQGGGSDPVNTFITCATADPSTSPNFMERLFDFVDRGCSRPEVIISKDPSLMYYGLVRAIIMDLRYEVRTIHVDMEKKYNKMMSQPSRGNLAEFHALQTTLINLTLDTTGLRLAVASLNAVAEKMHGPDQKEIPLLSQETRDRLLDQMGLIRLLENELPFIINRAENMGNWTFNMFAFDNNNLLQLIAVATILSLPVTIVTGILGINWFDSCRIGLILGIIGGAVFILFVLFFWYFMSRHIDWQKSSRANQPPPQHVQTMAERRTWAAAEDQSRNLENMRINEELSQLYASISDGTEAIIWQVYTRDANLLSHTWLQDKYRNAKTFLAAQRHSLSGHHLTQGLCRHSTGLGLRVVPVRGKIGHKPVGVKVVLYTRPLA
ncbi:hypothetical protein PIIN_03141 [Serendipita indica DSM 11827]|uniref:Uncharacterized protein n=1 Tax=Serendipita indica (strain DSM 11827) TaxID=1109443 RepID=G4TD41_SERID|nr:hypothetical protein PIIN_03141 [Serendipita indica DSM 11827]